MSSLFRGIVSFFKMIVLENIFDNYYNIIRIKTKVGKCKWVNFQKIFFGAERQQPTSMKEPTMLMGRDCPFKM